MILNPQSTTIPFLRTLAVTVGAGANLVQIFGDGTQDALRVSCNIHKTVMGIPSPSTIQVWNLSADTRSAIQRSLSPIMVEAGWENVTPHVAFRGDVVSCYSERQGPDIVSKIIALQGSNAIVQGVVAKNYREGTPVKDIVKDLGGLLSGVTVDEKLLRDIRGRVGNGGWSYVGQVKDGLTQLAKEFGFSWTIDGQALRAVSDKSKFEGIVLLDGTDGGLMSIAPILNGPLQIRIGVKIKALYVPGVAPGTTVRVRNATEKGLEGDYRVHTADYSLDVGGDDWVMELSSFRYM